MFFGFMNQREKAEYNRFMYDLLKNDADAFGRVSQKDWAIADRMARKWVANLVKSGLL